MSLWNSIEQWTCPKVCLTKIWLCKILVICLVNNEKKVALKDFEYCRKNQMNDDLSHQKIANKNAKYHGLVYFWQLHYFGHHFRHRLGFTFEVKNCQTLSYLDGHWHLQQPLLIWHFVEKMDQNGSTWKIGPTKGDKIRSKRHQI